ncbi:MAG: heat-inducible transcriptional repressor HrcA [Clostridiales Family XIII bacterium]|jgi:transcriptional regulator of heat shock response|nr:heat-inducible transcriptional repressor HrcA [Clostridiales Family XIII bacterium]
MIDLTERKLRILQAIVSDFIRTAEPVGSRALSRKHDMGVSPATIRNEMADLEDMGYLTHPHTSAGRVPSDQAYRLYVNRLMDKYELAEKEKKRIRKELLSNITELEKTIKRASELLSELTNLTSFATLQEDMFRVSLFLEGMTRIFAHPEFNNVERARNFLEMVDHRDDFTATITERDDGITITIGGENPGEIMPDSSIISATYHVGGHYVGKLGVIGPTRMRYGEITSVIDYMTKNIDRSFDLIDDRGGADGADSQG